MYLSAYKNLEILGKLSNTNVSCKRIMKILEMVGLEKRHASKVKTFSHGMKQRLGLAQALLHDPELIILDEPTTGLDPQGIKEIRDLILFLSRDKGKTILLSSHILKEVQIIATRMIIINRGKTIVQGTVDQLMNSEKMKVKVAVDDIQKAKSCIELTMWKNNLLSADSNELEFKLDNHEIAILNKHFVESGIEVHSLVPTRSLEDYFLRITEGSEV